MTQKSVACPACKSENVSKITRIVGYFSKTANWSKSKLEELASRVRGNYTVN